MQIFSVAVVILWIVVAVRTVQHALTGEIFYAPCLENIKKRGVPEKDDDSV